MMNLNRRKVRRIKALPFLPIQDHKKKVRRDFEMNTPLASKERERERMDSLSVIATSSVVFDYFDLCDHGLCSKEMHHVLLFR